MAEKPGINSNTDVSPSAQINAVDELEPSTPAENGEQAEAKATDEEEPSRTAVKVEQAEQTQENTSSLSDIKKSKEWRILAYSANQEHCDHHNYEFA